MCSSDLTMPPPKKWPERDDYPTQKQRYALTQLSKHNHYSAVVIKTGILQLKPTQQFFSSVQEWCAAMHQPPPSTHLLLDHAKVIQQLQQKQRYLSLSLHRQQQKIAYAQSQLLRIQHLITRNHDAIA